MHITLPGKSLFSPPKQAPLPAPAPPVPVKEDDTQVQEKKTAARVAANKRRGFLSTQTNVGGGLGITDAPTTQRKTLG